MYCDYNCNCNCTLSPLQDIDKQLTLAGEAFLESSDGCQVDIKKKEVKFSRIFKWYREDFGKSDKEVCINFNFRDNDDNSNYNNNNNDDNNNNKNIHV